MSAAQRVREALEARDQQQKLGKAEDAVKAASFAAAAAGETILAAMLLAAADELRGRWGKAYKAERTLMAKLDEAEEIEAGLEAAEEFMRGGESK